MVKELTLLTPAEVLLLISTFTSPQNLARATFLDLVFKQVLNLKVSENPTKKEMKNPLVGIGQAFKQYKPLKHEAIFTEVFKNDTELKLKLSQLVKAAFEDIYDAHSYRMKYIYTPKRMGQYFKSGFFQWLVGNKDLSRHGQETGEKLALELKRLQDAATKKQEDVVETLLSIKGNIVLLSSIPSDVFDELNRREKEGDRRHRNEEFLYWGYTDVYFPNHSTQQHRLLALDDSCIKKNIDYMMYPGTGTDMENEDGPDTDGSGCSGCSGCGGCGG